MGKAIVFLTIAAIIAGFVCVVSNDMKPGLFTMLGFLFIGIILLIVDELRG